MLPSLPVFIDREGEIDDLKQGVESCGWRCLLVYGRKGMGKTRLLEKFRDDFSGPRPTFFYCDLIPEPKQPPQDYFLVTVAFLGRFGAAKLPRLSQALKNWLQAQRSRQTDEPQARSPVETDTSPEAPGSQPGQAPHYTFTRGVDARWAQFISAEMVIQVYLNSQDTPRNEQDGMQIELTLALKEDLRELCQQEALVLLFDHWEAASPLTRNWLASEIFRWVLSEPTLDIQLIAASAVSPEWYTQTTKIKPIRVDPLPEDEVRAYWRSLGLPEEDFAPLYTTPAMLVTAVEEARLRRYDDRPTHPAST